MYAWTGWAEPPRLTGRQPRPVPRAPLPPVRTRDESAVGPAAAAAAAGGRGTAAPTSRLKAVGRCRWICPLHPAGRPAVAVVMVAGPRRRAERGRGLPAICGGEDEMSGGREAATGEAGPPAARRKTPDGWPAAVCRAGDAAARRLSAVHPACGVGRSGGVWDRTRACTPAGRGARAAGELTPLWVQRNGGGARGGGVGRPGARRRARRGGLGRRPSWRRVGQRSAEPWRPSRAWGWAARPSDALFHGPPRPQPWRFGAGGGGGGDRLPPFLGMHEHPRREEDWERVPSSTFCAQRSVSLTRLLCGRCCWRRRCWRARCAFCAGLYCALTRTTDAAAGVAGAVGGGGGVGNSGRCSAAASGRPRTSHPLAFQ